MGCRRALGVANHAATRLAWRPGVSPSGGAGDPRVAWSYCRRADPCRPSPSCWASCGARCRAGWGSRPRSPSWRTAPRPQRARSRRPACRQHVVAGLRRGEPVAPVGVGLGSVVLAAPHVDEGAGGRGRPPARHLHATVRSRFPGRLAHGRARRDDDTGGAGERHERAVQAGELVDDRARGVVCDVERRQPVGGGTDWQGIRLGLVLQEGIDQLSDPGDRGAEPGATCRRGGPRRRPTGPRASRGGRG
jgi:hypothetical protein